MFGAMVGTAPFFSPCAYPAFLFLFLSHDVLFVSLLVNTRDIMLTLAEIVAV